MFILTQEGRIVPKPDGSGIDVFVAHELQIVTAYPVDGMGMSFV
jgi:hypothetical protein